MLPVTAHIEPLTNKIIACAIEVHKTLGPGLLESVYQECLVVELQGANLDVESDRRVPIEYKGRRIRSKLRLDQYHVATEWPATSRSPRAAQAKAAERLASNPSDLLVL